MRPLDDPDDPAVAGQECEEGEEVDQAEEGGVVDSVDQGRVKHTQELPDVAKSNVFLKRKCQMYGIFCLTIRVISIYLLNQVLKSIFIFR